MDGEIAAVIKNLIHIDKNAGELREKFKNEIENRKKQIDDEIEKLRQEIVENEIKKIEEIEKEEIKSAEIEAGKLLKIAEEKCAEIDKNYFESKEILIKQALDELFKIG